MTETVAVLKKKAGMFWQILQAVIIALILGLASWMFYTIDALQLKVAAIESSGKENMAQWKALTDLSDEVKKNQVEMLVNQRLFQILLDHNGIQINIEREGAEKENKGKEIEKDLKDVFKSLPKNSRKDRIDAFKEEQIRDFTRQQTQQSTLFK